MNNTDNHNQLIGLIDFDGTLFETEPLYDDCMDVLLHSHGITQLPWASYKNTVTDKYRFVTGTGWRIIIHVRWNTSQADGRHPKKPNH